MEITVSPLFSGEEGPYEIIVREMGPFETISPEERISGELTGGVDGMRAARYQLTGQAGTSVVIDLISDDFDSYLQIVDSRGHEYSNDDGGDMFNSRLSYDFSETETVTVVATSLGGDQTGRYQLSVSERTTTVEAEYRGVLEVGDERAYDGTLYDVYEYAGSAGSMIGVALESGDFDTVVYVANPDGTNLGRDDDGGGGTDSRLDVTLPENGTYRIYVVSLFDTTGEYRLVIYR
jgi:serine protease Do